MIFHLFLLDYFFVNEEIDYLCKLLFRLLLLLFRELIDFSRLKNFSFLSIDIYMLLSEYFSTYCSSKSWQISSLLFVFFAFFSISFNFRKNYYLLTEFAVEFFAEVMLLPDRFILICLWRLSNLFKFVQLWLYPLFNMRILYVFIDKSFCFAKFLC